MLLCLSHVDRLFLVSLRFRYNKCIGFELPMARLRYETPRNKKVKVRNVWKSRYLEQGMTRLLTP